MNRGNVVLVRFPHPSGVRGKKRPAVVVQSVAYAGVVGTEEKRDITALSQPSASSAPVR